MEGRIAGLIIGAFGLALVWVIYVEIRNAIAEGHLIQTLLWGVVKLVSMIVVAIVILSAFTLAEWGIEKLRLQIRKWWFRHLTDVTMETALRESPYELMPGGWGEPKYYIVDKRSGELVKWEEPDGAEAWILRQYVKQCRNEQQNQTSG